MSTQAIPPLPPGYKLVDDSGTPPLPAGYKLVDNPPAQAQQQPSAISRFVSALGSDLKGMLPSFHTPTLLTPTPDNPTAMMPGRVQAAVQGGAKSQQEFEAASAARKAAGYSAPYRAIAPVAEGIGVNVPGMEQAAAQGNSAGVLGHAAAVPTVMAATAGVAKAAPIIADSLPSTTRAAKLFGSVAADANKIPVSLENTQESALKLMDWQKKTQLGPTLNKFLNRITNPKLGPLTYEEARDFHQLLSKMSVDENIKMAPPVKFQVQRLAAGLKQDVGNAAGQVGRSADYYSAMEEYHDAAQLRDAVDAIKDAAKREAIKGLIKGAGAGVGGYAAYKLLFSH